MSRWTVRGSASLSYSSFTHAVHTSLVWEVEQWETGTSGVWIFILDVAIFPLMEYFELYRREGNVAAGAVSYSPMHRGGRGWARSLRLEQWSLARDSSRRIPKCASTWLHS